MSVGWSLGVNERRRIGLRGIEVGDEKDKWDISEKWGC